MPNLVGVERLPKASHWVHHDDAERVNQLLVDFFAPSLRRAQFPTERGVFDVALLLFAPGEGWLEVSAADLNLRRAERPLIRGLDGLRQRSKRQLSRKK